MTKVVDNSIEAPGESSRDLIHKLVEEATPVKRLPSPIQRTVQWVALSVACLSIGLIFFGIRADFAERLLDPLFLVESISIAVTAVLAASAAFVLAVPGLSLSRSQKIALNASILTWLCLAVFRWYSEGHEAASGLQGFHCFADTLALGVIPGIILFLMILRAASVENRKTAGIAMVSAISFAALATRYSCSFDHPIHLLATHYSPILVAGLAGIALGRTLLRWPRG